MMMSILLMLPGPNTSARLRESTISWACDVVKKESLQSNLSQFLRSSSVAALITMF
jgi:hypothetical protein